MTLSLIFFAHDHFSVRCKLACNKERLCAGFGRELGQQRCQMAVISIEGCSIWLGIFYVEHREFLDLLATFRQWLQYQLALFRVRVGGFAKTVVGVAIARGSGKSTCGCCP
jgi:hypothetical protein